MAGNHTHGTEPGRVGGPPEVEPRVGDQRPRERRYNRHLSRLSGIGAIVGAVVLVALLWIINLVRNAHGSEIRLYLFAALLGALAGPVLLPYLTILRQDGRDATIVTRRTKPGPADAPTAGAEEVDRERAEHGPPTQPPPTG